MKILVIDDSKTNRDAAIAQLGNDHEIITADSYDDAISLLSTKTKHPDFDVVLTDLLMPASDNQMGIEGMQLAGTIMPVGIFIAIHAAINCNVQYVCLITDTDHHDHPASACLDTLQKRFQLEDASVILTNKKGYVAYFNAENLAQEINIYDNRPENLSPFQWKQELIRTGQIVSAKNWALALDHLLEEDK